jgi:hypothetical protein
MTGKRRRILVRTDTGKYRNRVHLHNAVFVYRTPRRYNTGATCNDRARRVESGINQLISKAYECHRPLTS